MCVLNVSFFAAVILVVCSDLQLVKVQSPKFKKLNRIDFIYMCMYISFCN